MINRVATAHQYNTHSNSIATAQSNLVKLQNQISSGKRFEHSREDALGSSTLMQHRNLQSRLNQYQSNLRTAKEYLSQGEASFGELQDVVTKASTIALQGANATTDNNVTQTSANQVSQLQERLVMIGNTQISGDRYLFAGQDSKTKPFSTNGETLTFHGDTNPIQVEGRPNTRLVVNSTTAPGAMADLYESLGKLKKALLGGDTSAVNETIATLKSQSDEIIVHRGEIATKLQSVESLTSENTRRLDDVVKDISDVEDVDIAEALTKYKSAELGYQAALQVLSQSTKYSLMDFIR